MDADIDKLLNRKSGFRYTTIDAPTQVRLLRLTPHRTHTQALDYTLETHNLSDLQHMNYVALSYTWGRATTLADVRPITIDSQPFFVRRNLFDFLATALDKSRARTHDEPPPLFVDAICINQLDAAERRAQVREMAHVYRRAGTVVAWLGIPDSARERDDVRALASGNGGGDSAGGGRSGTPTLDCAACWTRAMWAGFTYLSYHVYWRRVWIVQEVLLARRLEVWCAAYTFPLSLFAGAGAGVWSAAGVAGPRTGFSAEGRPRAVVDDVSRACSPAERIVAHRTRHVLRPVADPLEMGTAVGTMEEMTAGLTRPYMQVQTYQSHVPDLIHEIIHKFGSLGCSDPRDKLYGFLGVLKDSSRARVNPDYARGVDFAYRQALKIGLEEIRGEHWAVDLRRSDRIYKTCLAYYCDVRDAFGMDDGESRQILRDVVGEFRSQSPAMDLPTVGEWRDPLLWNGSDVEAFPDFVKMLRIARPDDEETKLAWRFHESRHRILEKLSIRKLFPHR
ncbi:HET-domain-containing protein [Hypoxylon sp. NC1633]|nr:HET-domain-containing protein [Hypoxylon sp. NC1633]